MEIINVAILRVATTVAIEAVKITIEAMSAMTLAGDLATTGLRKTESMTEEVEVDPLFSKKSHSLVVRREDEALSVVTILKNASKERRIAGNTPSRRSGNSDQDLHLSRGANERNRQIIT